MNICSVCRQCYDDAVTVCAAESHGDLVKARDGSCLIAETYKVDSRIESDSPAQFYKAVHLASQKEVCIKFMSAASFEAANDEIEKAIGITHPNLARVFETGKSAGNEIYVVSEYVEGQTLREYLAEKSPLAERHAVKIARQIAEALETLHENGVIHRAVNPANIFFTNADAKGFSVKLQNPDFGGWQQQIVAKSANGIDARAEIFRYFSPEQLAGETIDARTDFYSLAVVFYEMLLGRTPYAADSPRAIADYVFNERDVEKLHFDLRALLGYTLRQSLQHRINLRPANAGNLARQLRHIEQLATPPEIVPQNSAAQSAKPKTPPIISTPIQMPPVEIQIPTQTKTVEPEPITPEIQLQETINAEIPEPIFAISAADDLKIEGSAAETETLVLAETLPLENDAQQFSEPEEQSFETYQTNKLPELPALEFGVIDRSESADDYSENIHITNKDDEDVESFYQTEPQNFDETEFENRRDAENSPRLFMNSFETYAPSSSSLQKISVYVGALLVLILIGGLIAARFMNRQTDETTSAKNAPTAPIKASEKRPETPAPPEKIADEKEVETAQIEELPNVALRESSDVAPQTAAKNPLPNETAPRAENAKTPLVTIERDVEIQAKKRSFDTPSAKKQNPAKTPAKEADVVIVGQSKEKTKPIVIKTDGLTRPRIVTNLKTGN